MKHFAVIGSPIAHSLSPAMHADFIAELGVAASYEAIDGARFGGNLRDIFEAFNLSGANVTLPYKISALEQSNTASQAALSAGAANTIIIQPDGSFYAHNTDIEGFLAPLKNTNLKGIKALILGAGGAARAVKFALENAGAKVSLLARSKDNELSAPTSLSEFDFELLVNATSASLKDQLPASKELLASLRGVQIAYDLAYAHDVFLREFADNVRKIDGRFMLAAQAAAAAELFYGARPSEALIAKWAQNV